MTPRRFIYIAGPYRGKPGVNGDHMSNCHDAMRTWRGFWASGVCAICPHWSFAQQLLTPMNDVDWLAYTMAQMTLCSAVYRLPGESAGSDAEVRAARELSIPVFEDWDEAVSYMRGLQHGKAVCGAEGMDCGDCSCGSYSPAPVAPSPEKTQSQSCRCGCHNTGACVWRLTDCSSGRSSPCLHGSSCGPVG
jgi:hypothetical protein